MQSISDCSNCRMTLRQWQQINKDVSDLIVQASVIDGSDSWQHFPIGMNWIYMNNYEKGSSIQIGNHDQMVISCFSPNTDIPRRSGQQINRKTIAANLLQNSIVNDFVPTDKYFEVLPSYKFVISPEGNGIDCHRHYEALIAGCIPIIEENAKIKKKYKGCPILFTKDYSEINDAYLSEHYDKMIDTEYDFSRLFLSYYDKETQTEIKQCGNCWVSRLTNRLFYPFHLLEKGGAQK